MWRHTVADVAQPIFPLVERILGVDLLALLHSWQAEGLSHYRIALRLRDDHDIDVSPETVRRWLAGPELDGAA
jgi:hypothetical protein